MDGVITADPVFLLARLELARLLAETEVAWADAEKMLSGPLPATLAADSLAAFYGNEYFEKMDGLWEDPEFDTWLSAHIGNSLSNFFMQFQSVDEQS